MAAGLNFTTFFTFISETHGSKTILYEKYNTSEEMTLRVYKDSASSESIIKRWFTDFERGHRGTNIVESCIE